MLTRTVVCGRRVGLSFVSGNMKTLVPLLTGIALTALCTCALLQWWWRGAAPAGIVLLLTFYWLWPSAQLGQTAEVDHAAH